MTEFELIDQFFSPRSGKRSDVVLGIGDDGALLQVPTGQLLVASTDTLIAGVHFPADTNPDDIGYKALAVNLSDLAAMGAEPAWILLALTLPQADAEWLKLFGQGFAELAQRYHLQLVGGDTARGSLSVTVQALGFVPPAQALQRNGAKAGDNIYVTGTLGDAGFALKHLAVAESYLLQRLNRPQPRVEAGLALRGIANSVIDVSDGLAADLGHILNASQVGASVNIEALPFSAELSAFAAKEDLRQLALSAGDDYELCFTVSPEREAALAPALRDICRYTCIGRIEEQVGLRLRHQDGKSFTLANTGFRHF